MQFTPVIEYLRKHEQAMDCDIAEEVGIPVERVRLALSLMAMQGSVEKIGLSRDASGKHLVGISYRTLKNLTDNHQ